VVLTVVLTVVLIVVLPGVGNASCGRYLTQLAGLAVSDRYERGWGSYPTYVWCWLSSVGYIMAYLLGHIFFSAYLLGACLGSPKLLSLFPSPPRQFVL
jgi:hypothetical protein